MTYTEYDYDNLNRVVETKHYWDYNSNGPGSGDRLLTDAATAYDNLGRAYQTTTYAVSMTTYARTGDSLVGNVWYDATGNVIKSQAAGAEAFTKTVYDGLGRARRSTSATTWTRRPTARPTTWLATRSLSRPSTLTTLRTL